MYDLFAEPIGSEPADQNDDENAVLVSPVPPEAYRHPGKWVALRAAHVVAVKDSFEELRDDPKLQDFDISFFHVPTTRILAR
jgi:hypothetical protein